MTKEQKARLRSLRAVLDRQAGRYKELAGAADYADYLAKKPSQEDEEILTEPVLAKLLEDLLEFPTDAYFPQFSKGGLKPDLTPMDTIAHPFVLDAKSSLQDLVKHEPQIRTYIDERRLDFGILFNLREFRVYRRGEKGYDPALSFRLQPLWEAASGTALAIDAELAALDLFIETFRFREMGLDEKVERISAAEPWSDRDARGETIEVDIDYLVEQLRDLSRQLTDDAAAQQSSLEGHLKLNPGREQAMLGELEALAQDIDPGTALDSLPSSVGEYVAASEGLAARVWRQYLLRVAQLCLARIVLYRAWEDVNFVDDCLYDGGFRLAYDRLDGNLRNVLNHAFAEGLQRYPWLYGADNNYDWYRPRPETLVDVLYALIPFALGKLDADVLGGLYESYVEEIDRDRLGQFYTPRAVVRFMLQQAGFDGSDGIFRIEGDQRGPKRLLDFASGSGGFLVEAARRIIDRGGLSLADPEDLGDGLVSIVSGLHGCEISPFPYYLTEINLLLQVSRLLGALSAAGEGAPGSFVLGAVHADTLTARSGGATSIEGLAAEERTDAAILTQDPHFGLIPLDPKKQAAFDRIREDGAFDIVIGNPPYVFETNNRLLFERLRLIPAWTQIYQGKSDYLYYFLYLAIEKLAPGGRLCVITPAGWMNAGNADWLRKFVADNLRLDDLYLFGSHRLFAPEREARHRRLRAPTPTVESAILTATKADAPRSHKLRVVALENEAEAAKELAADPDAVVPDRDLLLAEMARRRAGRAGRRGGIHVHDVRQADLVHDRPWPIKHGARDVGPRVVAHLQAQLDDAAVPVEPLSDRWAIPQGIQTGADAYTPRIQQRLSREFPDAKRELDQRGAETGAPIMELPAGWETRAPWKDNAELLARSIEPDAILYGAMDEARYTSLVWIGRDDKTPQAVIDALEPWKPVLANRAEIRRNEKRRWWETTWPRDKQQLRQPKVIALYRTDRGRFALDEAGDWQPSIKTTLAIPKEDGLSVAYLCGLLNSELLDLWYAVRGKTPWHVRRNYEPKPMGPMPYRHVDGIADAGGQRLTRLDSALAKDAGAAAAVAGAIGAELAEGVDGAERLAAAAIERLVRAIAANRRELLPYRSRFPGLGRVVKDPWSVGPIEASRPAYVADLKPAQTISVRLDPSLDLTIENEGALGRGTLVKGAIQFRHGRQDSARVAGPEPQLALLSELVAQLERPRTADLGTVLLPKDPDELAAHLDAETATVARLLDNGRTLVEACERLICRLHGLPPELEDEVVAHALTRAAATELAETV